MRIYPFAACFSLIATLSIGVGQAWSPWNWTSAGPAGSSHAVLREIRKGWSLHPYHTLPESITTLMVEDKSTRKTQGFVYAGTSGSAGIYRVSPLTQNAVSTLSNGMGDALTFGTCHINRVVLHDMDGDGLPELLGSSSQVEPRGRPRLCVWSSSFNGPALRAVARPEIASSWSHSIDFLPRPGKGSDSVFVTFCGFGEVVEYRLEPATEGSSFHGENLGWKVVGTLPTSGEWLQIVDADNDGKQDICVATGYSPGHAAVILYASDEPGSMLRETRRLDEGGRFGNVRFLAGPLEKDGGQDLIAWWCTGNADGDAEVIVYRLGGEGIVRRTVVARGPASDLWADDDRFTFADLDDDGRKEVWFSTYSGKLWRFDPAHSNATELMASFQEGLGPVASGPDISGKRQRLYLGWERQIFGFELQPSSTN